MEIYAHKIIFINKIATNMFLSIYYNIIVYFIRKNIL